MATPLRSIQYRIWNQTRVGMHLNTWFHTWDVLDECPLGMHWKRAGGPRLAIRQTLFQSMITHLDFMKAKQGVSLFALINEAGKKNLISEIDKQSLQNRIEDLAPQMKKISRQRNSIVSHRSAQFGYKDIKESHYVTRDDLRLCCDVFYKVATQLCVKVPFRNQLPWQLTEARRQAEQMRDALIEPDGIMT